MTGKVCDAYGRPLDARVYVSSAPGRSRTLLALGPEPGCTTSRHMGWVSCHTYSYGPSNMGLVPEPRPSSPSGNCCLVLGPLSSSFDPCGPSRSISLNVPVVSGRKSLVTSSHQLASMAELPSSARAGRNRNRRNWRNRNTVLNDFHHAPPSVLRGFPC
ncbi:hypothetical protein LY78DRAFT_71541 [Colletotrichum sublineola]|nr:hypothetical protein LY78DRAFT_71541 [Colletotrichum sublineola]